MSSDDWVRYQRLVLHQLDVNSKALDEQSKLLAEVRADLAALKVRAGVWGLVAGLMPAIGVLLYRLIH